LHGTVANLATAPCIAGDFVLCWVVLVPQVWWLLVIGGCGWWWWAVFAGTGWCCTACLSLGGLPVGLGCGLPIAKFWVSVCFLLVFIGTWLYLATAPFLAGDCVVSGTRPWWCCMLVLGTGSPASCWSISFFTRTGFWAASGWVFSNFGVGWSKLGWGWFCVVLGSLYWAMVKLGLGWADCGDCTGGLVWTSWGCCTCLSLAWLWLGRTGW